MVAAGISLKGLGHKVKTEPLTRRSGCHPNHSWLLIRMQKSLCGFLTDPDYFVPGENQIQSHQTSESLTD